MKRRRRPKRRSLVLFILMASFAAAAVFPGIGSNTTIEDSITFTGILFGIIVGFFIADLYSRYSSIRTNAAQDASCLATFYRFAVVMAEANGDQAWLDQVKTRTERYIHDFMPLPWEKYGQTEPAFSQLSETLKDLKYKGEKPNETYTNILVVNYQHSTARENLVMFGKDKLTAGEWTTAILLGILLTGSLFYVKTSSLTSTLFTGGITAAVLMLFMVLSELNNLNFGQEAISIEPYERVLDAIGRPRYYSSDGKETRN